MDGADVFANVERIEPKVPDRQTEWCAVRHYSLPDTVSDPSDSLDRCFVMQVQVIVARRSNSLQSGNCHRVRVGRVGERVETLLEPPK